MSLISFKGFDGSASVTADSPVVFFWGTNEKYGMFSQWYTSSFFCDGNQFTTAEQYMMYRKAGTFGDASTAAAILKSPKKHPRQHKAMGRAVKGFRDDVWDAAGVDAAVVGNLCKFTQNAALMAALMGTTGSVLAEASPYDYIWGIGFKEEYAMDCRHAWGANKLGKCLMIVRDIIQHMSDSQGFHKITSTDAIAQICSDKQASTSGDRTVAEETPPDANDDTTALEDAT
ncbi:hypothetical protein PG993_013722 [Apiospora rasikravindrae]|uniref:NADAR domain-containing protein n=1 Tax=Apiospora rasikravindrae TaxID=990691 RepID=A0ABR1RQZ7_9PEZI